MSPTTQTAVEVADLLLSLLFVRRDVQGWMNDAGDIYTIHQPIHRAHLQQHLRGGVRRGAHCIAEDNTVIWGAVDIDDDHLPTGLSDQEAVRRVVAVLVAAGFSCLVERSKSRGYHVWIFLAGPLPAWKVRGVLCALVADAGLPDLEVFPKQNYREDTKDGFGNFVWLPWHGGSVRNQRTVFVDTSVDGWPPLQDQVQTLRTVARIPATVIETILTTKEIIQPEPKGQRPETTFSDQTPDVALDSLRIPRATKQLIVSGWTAGGPYKSRSEFDGAVVMAMVYAGHTDDEIRAVFRNAAWRIGEKYREEGDHYLGVTIASARRQAGGNGSGTSGERSTAQDAPRTESGVLRIENLTDLGNAKRFAHQHGLSVRYCYQWKSWWVWDGRRWVKDDSGLVLRLAKDTVLRIYGESSRVEDEDHRKAIAKHAVRSEADNRIQAMLSLAQSEPGIPIAPAAFDTNPWLITVQNGTVNLRTGTLCPHRRDDLITKIIPVEYDVTAETPIWDAFLTRIFDGDATLITYIRQATGYSLTGSTKEQCWFLLHGSGANGKTTFVKTITDLLVDYAIWTPPQTLLAKRGERIDNDVARLRGSRLVAAVETEGGRRLAEALVKQLTGGDKVTARFLFSEFFEFTPQFKLWLATNHKPEIRGTDHAVWRRIRLIPFTVTIPDAEQDRDLPEKLRAEFPGILRWAVAGCLAWQAQGLGLPDPVKAATQEYRETMDLIGAFVSECCEEGKDAEAGAAGLYRSYVKWAEQTKEQVESQRRFGEALAERGYTRTRGNKGEVVWKGLRLRPETI